MTDLVPDGSVNRSEFDINTRNDLVIIKINKNYDKVIWRESATEMENHADTHCFGANFRPL